MTPQSEVHAGLLERWGELSPEEKLEAFRALDRGEADDFFLDLDTRDQAELLASLPDRERRLWIRLLPPDDAADLIQYVPEDARASLMAELDPVTRREVAALLAYAEDAAGGLMNPRFARLRPDMTVDEAISYLRRQALEVAIIYYAYVLDPGQRLLGVVSFRELFTADPSRLVRDVMRSSFISVSEGTDQERIAQLIREYRLLAVPVVDAEGRMKGVVTADDIAEVMEEEASEDFQKVGGMEALDEPYLRIRLGSMLRKRGGWLAALFLGETLTATAMSYFEEELARAVVLATFVPLIISSGGNSGSQAATLVIRAMAVGEVRLRDWWRVMRRELATGLALGSLLAAIGFTRIVIWHAAWEVYGRHYLLIAATVAVSLLGVVLLGTIAGSMLPFLLRKMGVDPASASAPFVATLVDVSGLVIYFTAASAILAGTLL